MFVEKGGAVPWALNSKLVGYVLMPGLEGGGGACLALGFSMLQSERGGKSPQLFPLTDGLQRLFQLPAPAGTAASGPAVSASVQEAYAATLLSWRAGILKAAGGYNSLSALDELVPLVGHGGASLFKQKRWHEVACALNQLQMRVALGPPGALPPAGKFEAVKFWATRGTHASAAGAGACAAALAATAVQPSRVGLPRFFRCWQCKHCLPGCSLPSSPAGPCVFRLCLPFSTGYPRHYEASVSPSTYVLTCASRPAALVTNPPCITVIVLGGRSAEQWRTVTVASGAWAPGGRASRRRRIRNLARQRTRALPSALVSCDLRHGEAGVQPGARGS